MAPRLPAAAFSLVETTLAIGVVAVALVSMLGLVPVGLSSFRDAVDASTSSRIVQRVSAHLRQGTQVPAHLPVQFFDEQGDEVALGSGSSPAIYHVNTVVQPGTSLPGGESSSLATVTVEIVRSPGGTVPRDPVTQAFVDQPGRPVWRYPIYIATQNL